MPQRPMNTNNTKRLSVENAIAEVPIRCNARQKSPKVYTVLVEAHMGRGVSFSLTSVFGVGVLRRRDAARNVWRRERVTP